MKRMLLNTLLTAGFFFLASGIAFAQRHPGWPTGPASGGASGGHEQARQVAPGRISSPAVRPEVRNESGIRNERMNGEHPFYGNDRGRGNDWRYTFDDGRWWYWTPLGAWAYWDDGRWMDYSEAVPYTANYRGPMTAPTGWYWNSSVKQWFWFDGTNLTPAQQ